MYRKLAPCSPIVSSLPIRYASRGRGRRRWAPSTRRMRYPSTRSTHLGPRRPVHFNLSYTCCSSRSVSRSSFLIRAQIVFVGLIRVWIWDRMLIRLWIWIWIQIRIRLRIWILIKFDDSSTQSARHEVLKTWIEKLTAWLTFFSFSRFKQYYTYLYTLLHLYIYISKSTKQ